MKHFVVTRNVLTVCLLMIVYYFIMEYYYLEFICRDFLRFGFHVDINQLKYFETKVIFIFVLCFSLYVSRKSEFIYAIFIFFVIFFLVPGLITYSISNQISGPLYAVVFLLFALGIISVIKIKIPVYRSTPLSHGVLMALMVLLLLPILFTFGVYFNPSNLFLEDVYSTRDIFDEKASTATNYFYNWLIKAIVPVGLIFFLLNKRYWYAAFSFVILLYLYVISGNKLVYITSFVMLFFFFLGSSYLEKVKKMSFALVLGLIVMTPIDYYIFGGNSLKGIFVMRMLFLPSYLNYYYFDFFKDRPLYFAESHFFNMFNYYPFDKPVGYVIARNYLKVSDMNANNGVIGDGYMNLGYPGVVLSILVVVFVFLFFNSANLNSRYLGIFFVIIFLFLSLPLLSMFLTSGLWIIFLLSLTIMRNRLPIKDL